MIKQSAQPNYSTIGRGDNVFISPIDGPVALLGNSVMELSVSLAPDETGICKKSDIPHIAALQQKRQQVEMQKTGKQMKSILKNSPKCYDDSDSVEINPQKLSVSKIRCVLKKRKTTNNNVKTSVKNIKSEKKVKFDDKLSRLTELGMKYGKEVPEKENKPSTPRIPSPIRQHKQIQKVSLRGGNTNKPPPRKQSSITISNMYDLKGPLDERPFSPFSPSKSVSSISSSVHLHDRRNSGSDHQFVRMDFQQDNMPIPIYNPQYSSYPPEPDISTKEETEDNADEESKLINNGIPAFTKCGKFIKSAEILKENITADRSKTSPDSITNVKPNYRVVNMDKKLKQEQDFLQGIPGHRKAKGKTTVNTTGGATVTRSHNPPFMFSRYAKEVAPIPAAIPNPYKNYCDDIKTYQIVSWLRNVSDVQAKEGFCTLLNPDTEIAS